MHATHNTAAHMEHKTAHTLRSTSILIGRQGVSRAVVKMVDAQRLGLRRGLLSIPHIQRGHGGVQQQGDASTDVQGKAVSVVVQVTRRALVNLFRASAHWCTPRHRFLPSQAALCTWRIWPGRTCCRRHCPAPNSYLQSIIYHWKRSTLSHVRSFELSIAAPRHCVSTMLCKSSGENVKWPSPIKIL